MIGGRGPHILRHTLIESLEHPLHEIPRRRIFRQPIRLREQEPFQRHRRGQLRQEVEPQVSRPPAGRHQRAELLFGDGRLFGHRADHLLQPQPFLNGDHLLRSLPLLEGLGDLRDGHRLAQGELAGLDPGVQPVVLNVPAE